MIDAVTYGMIPSAKIEKRESAEPREQVQQAEERAALAVEEVLDLRRVDARRGHQRAEPVARRGPQR